MAEDDDSTIWIDVKARLDESSADEVEGKLKGKLSHVGDSLKDSLSTAFDSIGDKLGGAGGPLDKLHDMLAGTFSGKEWDSLGQRAGTALGQGVGEALKDVTQGNFGSILGEFGKVGDVLGGAVDKLSSRLDGLQKAGGAVGNVLSGNASGSDIDSILGGAKNMGFNIPGPVNQAEHVKQLIDEMNQHPGKTEDWLSSHIPGIGVMENIFEKGPQKVGETIHDWFTDKPSSPARDAASDKWSSSVAGAIDIQSNTATVSAGSVTLAGGISIPGLGGGGGSSGGGGRTTSTGVAAAGGDSGSMASLYSGGGGMTIGKGHSTGGILPGDSPGHDNMIGVLPSGKMVSLEGGEGVIRPEAMGRPGVSDLISSLNQHYDEGTGGGGVGGGSGGDPNNTTLSTPPTQANNAGGSGTQQDQLGKGQGGGVTGGGAIGMAEQAAVMAATVGGFGAGGIAAQMGVQETNLAIQKTSQMAAALATAPFETLGLGGGMMGAPKVNPMGGWLGKLVAGELGQQTNLPNLASSVQPPKKPDQKPDDDQQPQGETPTGPTGDRDDPMHVKVTNPQQPPQGSATSAMSTLPAMTMAP